MKILNLYAGIGGNRKLWGNEHQITAVELDAKIANKYANLYPFDNVIVSDAHEYLLDHYKEFDFIWSSPPCPTHSKTNYFTQHIRNRPVYPSMKLYEEIIFLQNYYKGKYVVENVIPYYEPLIPAQKRGRHLYWTNFNLPNNLRERKIGKGKMCGQINKEREFLERFHKIDLSTYAGTQDKRKIARNLVDYEAGKTILDTAMGIIQKQDINQTELF
jgi:DNA (cytosine-5)-methyltransferase 1